MPLNKHFKGHGKEVMANMEKQYGKMKAKKVFYATDNKKHSIGPSEKAKENMKNGKK